MALAAPAHAEKRVALVIGNNDYSYVPLSLRDRFLCLITAVADRAASARKCWDIASNFGVKMPRHGPGLFVARGSVRPALNPSPKTRHRREWRYR
jgi:hypothetical protein